MPIFVVHRLAQLQSLSLTHLSHIYSGTMLIAPFLLTGIAALSALFLNTSPRLGRLRKAHQGLLGQTTVYVLGCAISEYLRYVVKFIFVSSMLSVRQ